MKKLPKIANYKIQDSSGGYDWENGDVCFKDITELPSKIERYRAHHKKHYETRKSKKK